MNDTDSEQKVRPDGEEVIFVPDEVYHNVHRALNHMEKARDGLRQAAEEIEKTERHTTT